MARTLVVLALVGSGAAAPAAAQTAALAPHPTDAAAAVPAAGYQSVFDGYRAFREESLGDWRALNQDVAGAGGHIGIMGGASGHAAKQPPGNDPAPKR